MRPYLLTICWIIVCFFGVEKFAWGQFGKQRTIFENKTSMPEEMLTVDVDRDGDMDIVFVAYSHIGWYENKGKDDYNHLKIIDVNLRYANQLSFADLDGDGLEDLATLTHDDFDMAISTYTDCRVIWYKGDGNGNFEGRRTLFQGANDRFSTLKAADINGDGLQDVLVGTIMQRKVWYLKSLGNGAFATPQIILDSPTKVYDIESADLNQDGAMDIVVGSGAIEWFENDGEGNLSKQHILNPGFNGQASLHIADVNGDGLEDVIAAGTQLVWFRNTGGGFTVQKILTQNAFWPNTIEVIDMDDDGDKDIIASSPGSAYGQLFWYENDGSLMGNFGEEQHLYEEVIVARDLQTADLDKDGDIDIVSSTGNGIVSWHENLGGGTFEEMTVITASTASLNAIFSTDMDGDGDIDILSAAFGDGRIAWYENEESGLFGQQQLIDIYKGSAVSVFAGDLDGDIDKDVVMVSWANNKIFWYENFGEEKFSSGKLLSDQVDEPQNVYLADLDSDGDLDVLSTSKEDNKVAWYRNDGIGNFEPQIIITYLNGANSLEVADLDKDGDLDVLAAGTSIVWCVNDGHGNFSTSQIITNGINWGDDVIAVDLDNDGDLDVLSASMGDDEIAWYEQKDNGSFGVRNIIDGEADGAVSVVAFDFDKDGDNDVVAASRWKNQIVWYQNNNGEFIAKQNIAVFPEVSSPVDLRIDDVDGDGNMDLLSASSYDGKIAWYENISDYSVIKGYTYYDANQNGNFDTEELPLFNQNLLLQPDAANIFTDENGLFEYFVADEHYTLTYQQHPLWELVSENEAYDIQVLNNEELPLYNFGFIPSRVLPRVEPHINSAPTRCDNIVTYWLSYLNTGTTSANGIVTFEYDELMSFVEATPSPTSFQDGKWIWHFSNLQPSFESQIELKFKMPGFEFIEELLTTKASVQVISDLGNVLSDRSTEYASELLCSYDPNDKLFRSNLLGQSETAYITDTLLYTIRFQNTGNDTAFNIRIEDILDKRLDWTTFHPITASHNYRTSLNRETGLATFYFENILLPDSSTNEPESHGFIQFGIASLENIEDKTAVENTASIFFDFNPPIVTNTVSTLLIELDDVGVETLEGKYTLKVSPNPFSNYTTIELKGFTKDEYQLKLMDITGRSLLTLPLEEEKTILERGNLSNGLYIIQVSSLTTGQIVGSKKIVLE